MMKKFLSGLLACAMALGIALPVAGCKPQEDVNKDNGQNQEQQNGGGQGGGQNSGQGEGQGDKGEQNGGDEGKDKDKDKPLAPGTVITDNAVKGEFYNALSESELSGFHYSLSASLEVEKAGETSARKISAEGAIMLSNEDFGADLYLSEENDAEEAGKSYFLCFVRGENLYTVSGEWEKEGEVDFNALKEQLKAEKNRLLLNREEDVGQYVSLAKSKTVYKILKNMPAVFEGVLTKTEGGYTLSFDVGKSVGGFLKSLRPLAELFDQNHELSVGGLFKEESVKTLLETLLKGVTAEELVETVKPMLPETLAAALPKPAKAQKASDYADGLLRSGSFYQELTKENEGFEKWKTFAEMPLKELFGILTGSELTFEPKMVERFDEFTETLKTSLIDTLFKFAGVEEGELSDEMLQISMTFSFDEEKHLLGFSADALAGGNKTEAQQQEGEGQEQEDSQGQQGENQEGSQGQENQGQEENGGKTDEPKDETQKEAEAEKSEKETEQKALENAEGGDQQENNDANKDDSGANKQDDHKTALRGTVKIEASGASSPILYDLTGCKYRSGEGETSTIRAKK